MEAHSLAGELAPYLAVRREGRPLSALVDALSPAATTALWKMAMLMIRPDAIVGGHGSALLDWLEDEHGVCVVAFKMRAVDARLFDALYVTELDVIAQGLRLHHRLAAAGPSAFAVVTAPSSEHESAALLLDRLKGESAPSAETSTNTVRARFGRQSSFHVVLHTSEDAGDFLSGSVSIFGWDETVHIIDAVASGSAEQVPRSYRDLLMGEAHHAPRRDVFSEALSIKRRILAVLLRQYRASRPPAPLVDVLERIYDGCDLDVHPLFRDRRDRYLQMATAERSPLDQLLAWARSVRSAVPVPPAAERSTPSAEWRELDRAADLVRLVLASRFLSGHDEYDLDDGRALVEVLERNSIVLSPVEADLLRAGLTADLNPAGTFKGERVYPIAE